MKLLFDTNGNDKQKECCRYWINDTTTEIAYGGSKGSGKSYLGAQVIFSDALTYPDTHYFIARKKLNDLRKFTVPSIHEVFSHWGLDDNQWKYNGQDSFYELYNGSKVFLIEAKYMPSDPLYMRFGSMQMTRGWIEEAGEFESEAKNNLAASIGRWNNDKYGLTPKLLMTCNPSKNFLYKEFYKKSKTGELEDYKKFIQALPADNKSLDSGYLENLWRSLSPNQRKRLLDGDWEYDDDPNALCDYDSILDIFKNDHVTGDKKYITADIARMGSDKAIILVWEGWKVVEIVQFAVSRTTEIQSAIQALRTKHGIPTSKCIADEDGVGGGVIDNCKIKGFVNNSKPLLKQNYFNLQSQCCYLLAEKINQAEVFIEAEVSDRDKEQIIEDMEVIKSYDSDKDGKLRVLPKEKIKDLIGRSPDWRDALMMRAWFDLKPSGNYSIR